jgi:antitoxin PrlF
MLQTKVAERGQITIPKPIRERLGIKPGIILTFSARDGKLIATKITIGDPTQKYYGCLGKEKTTNEIMKELRG